MEHIVVKDNSSAKDAIIAIGEELIKRAEDITNDLDRVASIEIHATLTPAEAPNVDVTKNYIVWLKEEK